MARLDVEYQHDQLNGRPREREISSKRNNLYQKISVEQAPTRKKFEQAIKPYLDERLRQFDQDKAAGFMHPGQIVENGYEVRTASGRQVNKIDGTTRNGNVILNDAGINPLYGQLLIDGRYDSWGADRMTDKRDDETGEVVSSAQRVVDIAAQNLQEHLREVISLSGIGRLHGRIWRTVGSVLI